MVKNMRIGEIAKLAGVSISTVSKIVNGKDKGISSQTRERVMAIVKEYNYQPYASVIDIYRNRTFLLGFHYDNLRGIQEITQGIINAAQQKNYNVILSPAHYNPELTMKNISRFMKNGIDGLIWNPPENFSLEQLEKRNIEVAAFDEKYNFEKKVLLDFRRYGYILTEKMITSGHRDIVCVAYKNDTLSALFLEGYQQCLFDHNILFDEDRCILYHDEIRKDILFRGFTGFICIDEKLALNIHYYAHEKKHRIPEDFSILTLLDSEPADETYPKISALVIPFYEFGEKICRDLIRVIENEDTVSAVDFPEKVVHEHASLSPPAKQGKRSIIVVGSVHMDNIINVDEVPQAGKTVKVGDCNLVPGGKGTNQAVGVAKLGGEAHLLGKIGKDFDGITVLDELKANHIDLRGIVTDGDMDTGKAFIYVQKNGESSISTYSGANNALEESDIENNLFLFQDAGYCLLSTEIPDKVIDCTLNLAMQCGVKTILKPSSTKKITDSILKKTTYFVPNLKEANALCSHYETIEEKADFFLARGAENVIVTLGAEGCYVKGAEYTGYFPAMDFSAIDTTGGADAFISTLAVYLSEDYPFEEAVQYAICAAGFAVTRQGVVPALVDRTTLDLYMAKQRS